MSASGVILQFAYRLSRHFWLGWTLARWLGLLILGLGIWFLVRWWPNPWPSVATGVILVFYAGILVWARRTGYLLYTRLPDAERQIKDLETPPPLRHEELLHVRASGWFSVEGQDQYFVDADADYETVGTREHIVLGRVFPSRFLHLGNWPRHELGWWYVFIDPGMIGKVDIGRLIAGPQPERALRIVYSPDTETQQTVYLVADDPGSLRRIWEDLLKDAPPQVRGQANGDLPPALA